MILRRLASIVLIVLGGIALVGGILTSYADRNLLDPERFAERAVEALDDEGAQAEIGNVIVNELERSGVDRAEARKAVDRNIDVVAADERFRTALSVGLAVANEQALGAEKDDAEVVVEDIGARLAEILRERDPGAARAIDPGLDLRVADTGSTGTLLGIARAARDVSGLSVVLPILGGLMMIGGGVVANDRRTALFGAAMGVALAGAAIFAGYIGGREIAARQPDDDAAQEAARAIWDAVFGGLETLGLVMAGAGAVVALIAGVASRVRVPGRA
ncbi:MAG: hypothetical protein WKF62_01465 [Solirubrobacterales bacterium]